MPSLLLHCTHNECEFEVPQPRFLVVTVGHGLGDRIMVALKGLQLAAASGRQMIFWWERTPECNCPFHAIFKSPINTIDRDVEPFPEIGWNYNDYLAHGADSIVKLRGFRPVYPGNFEEFFAPSSAVERAVREFRSAKLSPNTLGVHVRRGDREPIALTHYYRHVDSVLRNGQEIFLSSDDTTSEVEGGFRKRYGDRIRTYPIRTLDRSIQDAIVDASINLWLLRSSSFVLGSGTSNFSKVAAAGKANLLVNEAGTYEY